jgi:glycosyltransferase involved in cell wall biosynthesis
MLAKVEILVEADNRERTTGAKRNMLYQKAAGKYVCSVDDDDDISDTYISDILAAAEEDPDAIGLNGTMSWDGKMHATWDISRNNPYITTRKTGTIHYLRYHNHLSPIRRTIALQFPFPDKSHGEDYEFATAIHRARAIKIEAKIQRPTYHYKYITNK